MDPNPPRPPPRPKEDDKLPSCSSEESLEPTSRQHRASVHYATIGEFLASLRKGQDTATQGVKSLGLDDYLRFIGCPEQRPPGEGDPVGKQAQN